MTIHDLDILDCHCTHILLDESSIPLEDSPKPLLRNRALFNHTDTIRTLEHQCIFIHV